MPRRVPVPPVDSGRGNVGERLEKHLALLGHVSPAESVATREAASLIQGLVPRPDRPGHRLSRVSLIAPLRNRRRQIAL